MDPPYPLAAGCTICLELSRHRTHIVHGYGDPQPKVLFISDAPERHGSDTTGVPLTLSERGRRFQVLLMALGLSEEHEPAVTRPRLKGAYVTHLVRCAPPHYRSLDDRELAHCIPYLWQEIALLTPRIIVPIGDLATRVIFGKYLNALPGSVEEIHAQLYPIAGAYLLPMLDPLKMTREEALVFTRVLAALLEDGQLGEDEALQHEDDAAEL